VDLRHHLRLPELRHPLRLDGQHPACRRSRPRRPPHLRAALCLDSLRAYRDPKPSDVVVFFKPTTEPNGDHLILVKCIIGVPGDRIHLLHGTVFRNGVAQVESHAIQPASGSYDTYRDDFPSVLPNQTGITATWSVDLPSQIIGGDLVIPPGNYFVMGDNRANSLDGRYWGFVPRANIIGRPLLVYWSFPTPDDQIDKTSLSDRASFTLHEAVHFFDETRWRRTLQVIP